VDEIVKGTLGRGFNYTGLVSRVAQVYRLLEMLKTDKGEDKSDRRSVFGSQGSGDIENLVLSDDKVKF
jgi:hypothetical protein